jgi:hypothetical protein
MMGRERFQKFSIQLDCPPGSPRPDDLIDSVLKGTGFEVSDFDTSAPFFGEQTWVLREDVRKDEKFTETKPTFKERISSLYFEGLIRYGTW